MKYIIINLTFIFFLTSCSSSKDSDLVSKFESNTDLFKELALKARYCSGYGYNDKKKTKENICWKIAKKLDIEYISVHGNGRRYYFRTESKFKYSKGYAFSRGILGPQFLNLDVLPDGVSPYDYGYKNIGNGWYIFIYNESD